MTPTEKRLSGSRFWVAGWIGLGAFKAPPGSRCNYWKTCWTLRQNRNSGMKFAVRIMVLAQMVPNCIKRSFARACMAKGPRRSAHGNSKRSPKASTVRRRAPDSDSKHPLRIPRVPPQSLPNQPTTGFPNLPLRGARTLIFWEF